MKHTIIYFSVILLLGTLLPANAQYLDNPSFEGPVGIDLCPPDWLPFSTGSTPDTEPLECDNYIASDGQSYLTLVSRGQGSTLPGSSENCQAVLSQSLGKDLCYTLSIDLSQRPDLGHYEWGKGFLTYSTPTRLNIYGSSSSSEKGSLLASSEVPPSGSWETQRFLVKPGSEFTYLILEAEALSSTNANGHILVDNMLLEMYSESYVKLNEDISVNDLPYQLEASVGSSYAWSPSEGLSCTDCRDPFVSSTSSETYRCILLPEGAECPIEEIFILNIEAEEDTSITPEPPNPIEDLKIPNVFTPNMDGSNDHFVILNLPDNSSLRIYNRSGKEVYASYPYLNDWDGSDLGGNTLPESTYWYVLITPGLNGTHKGYVYLKRN